jgi:hypothetical protein
LNVIFVLFVVSSTEVAVTVNWVDDATVYCELEPLIWQELPLAGAVTSTHDPLVEEIVPDPDVTAHVTWFVVPFVTFAKTRRVDPGITLNP